MSRHVGVVMDPIGSINFKKDTTLGLLLAAQAKGWYLWYMEQSDLYLDRGAARATMRSLHVANNPDAYFNLGGPEDRKLADLDAVSYAQRPPVRHGVHLHHPLTGNRRTPRDSDC